MNEQIAIKHIEKVKTIEDDLILTLDKTMRKLEKLLVESITSEDIIKTADIALALQNTQNLLLESGYYTATGEMFNTVWQEILNETYTMYNELYGKGLQFSEVSMQELEYFRKKVLYQFKNIGDNIALQVSNGIIDMQLGSLGRKELFAQISDVIASNQERYINTWIKTSTSGFYNEGNRLLAEDNGMNKFRYMGKIIKTSRDFCRRMINQVMTMAEWAKQDNEQGLPVNIYCGGYSCQHSLVAVE